VSYFEQESSHIARHFDGVAPCPTHDIFVDKQSLTRDTTYAKCRGYSPQVEYTIQIFRAYHLNVDFSNRRSLVTFTSPCGTVAGRNLLSLRDLW
jgi:hypothetical protein